MKGLGGLLGLGLGLCYCVAGVGMQAETVVVGTSVDADEQKQENTKLRREIMRLETVVREQCIAGATADEKMEELRSQIINARLARNDAQIKAEQLQNELMEYKSASPSGRVVNDLERIRQYFLHLDEAELRKQLGARNTKLSKSLRAMDKESLASELVTCCHKYPKPQLARRLNILLYSILIPLIAMILSVVLEWNARHKFMVVRWDAISNATAAWWPPSASVAEDDGGF